MITKEKLYKVLLCPLMSEKAYNYADEHNTIAFKVLKSSNKLEIKHAVEKLFEVNVNKVSTLIVKGKTKMVKRKPGKTKSWKKAYVQLAEGHDINFADKLN